MSKLRIQELEQRILKARDAYYNNGNITMSDQAYDALVDELKNLDPTNQAITMIGAPIRPTEWKKAKHQIPMGSLDKVNTPEELTKWANDVAPSEKFFVMDKLDGISIELIYENSKLVSALTRGDGFTGEEVIVNVVKMKGVQATLLSSNFTGSLRGEIIMHKSVHQKYFSKMANPRNATTGITKRLDGTDSEHLNVIFYQAIGNIEFDTEEDQEKWLIFNCLDTPISKLCNSAQEVNDYWQEYQDKTRAQLDWEVDGLVVRINDLVKQTALGEHNLKPKGCKAFKFDNESRETILLDVLWQTGHSGRLSPVAVFEPVNIGGANIERASIYNLSYIEELGLDVGATILVSRNNDVIPSVKEVIKGTGSVAKAPPNCPECAGYVEMQGEYLICTNSNSCPAQIKGRFHNWIKELNLLEWGDSLIDKLVESGKVNTIADLYTLTVDDLVSLERMGKKSAKKCYDLLWAAKEVPLEVFLGGLSIPMIGQSTIKLIMKEGCDTLEKFGQLGAEQFEQVPGVGPIKAKSLADGLKYNQQLILDLLDNGVVIKTRVTGKLSNTSICFTGTMTNKRSDLEKMAASAGADIKSSVGKGLTYLVISDPNSNSSKAVSARKIGTKLLSEDEFINLIK